MTNATGQNASAGSQSTNASGQSANATGRNANAASQNTNATGQSANATGQNANARGQRTNEAGQNSEASGQTGQNGNGGRQNANGGDQQETAENAATPGNGNGGGGLDRLRQMVQNLGSRGGSGGAHGVGGRNGPVTGNDYSSWTERVRDVEQVLDAPEMRNQLATARERVGALRADFRRNGKKPDPETVRTQVLQPMTEVRTWLRDELARREDANSLVPLDHDPVPENYSELVRKYYEKLGGGQ
jgi:hypothetical protein